MSNLPILFQMFIVFYSIPLISWMHTISLYSLYACFMILLKYRIELKRILKEVEKQYKLFTLFAIYTIFICLFNLIYITIDGGVCSMTPYIKTIYQCIVRTVMSFGASAYLAIICLKHKITFDRLMKYFIFLACIQFIFVIATYLSPMIKGVVIDYVSAHLKPTSRVVEILTSESYVRTRNTRIFGLAGNFFEQYGYVSTMFFLSAMYLGFKRHWSYLMLMPIPLISTAINSRTGVVLCIFTAACMTIKLCSRNIRFLCRAILLFVIMISGVSALMLLSPSENNMTYLWLQEGYRSILSLKSGIHNTTGSLNTLLTSHIVFPSSVVKLMFGEGYMIASPGITTVHSDIGYINIVWACGIIGSFLIYYTHLSFFMHAYMVINGHIAKAYIIGSTIAFFIMHYKTTSIGSSPTVIITYFIMLYSIMYNYQSYKELSYANKTRPDVRRT